MTKRAQPRVIDCSADFWPSGWMVYFCVAVGLLDVGLISFVILQATRHA